MNSLAFYAFFCYNNYYELQRFANIPMQILPDLCCREPVESREKDG